MHLSEIAPELYLIPLDQNLPGFKDFVGAWLYKAEKTILVDVGTSATLPVLLKALASLGVRRLDAILLTHIHIDHAGGIGDLVIHFPDTPVVCHDTAIRHLTDPKRLWEGSLKTLGQTARAYGPIRPVPPDLLFDAAQFRDYGIVPVLTPGHAEHHVSYILGPYLFAGEAGGVFLDLPDDRFYLRPATPPRFFLETYMKSLDALIERNPSTICYGHFGINRNALEMLEFHRHQLLLWEKIVRYEIEASGEKDLFAACLDRFLSEDPLMAGFYHMKKVVQEREKGFLRNSVKGFAGYLSERIADSV
ncbi:MBL fold metallo-hydrolase [Thermodesulfobacteriota bacterium]